MTLASPSYDALVIDASVGAKWALVDELYALQAAALLRSYRADEIELIAPAHILYEVPAAIFKATRGPAARLTPALGRDAIAAFMEAGIRTVNDTSLASDAYDFALEVGVAYYDALYGALSLRLGIPLVVADRQFFLRVHPYVDALWLGSVALA